MDHPRLVRGLQCLRDLLRHGQRLIQRDRPLRDPVSECRPLHQFQHQSTGALVFLDAVDLCDVRVVEAGKDLRFPLEPGQSIRICGKRLGQDLQRDIAVQLRIRGTPHFAHPAFTEFGGDTVMPESCADAKRH